MTHSQTAPVWLKIVAIIAVIWNLLGVFAFVVQQMMTPEMLAQLPLEQQALYADIPGWVTLAFACAVFGGLLGSVLLLMKKGLATVFFAISLAGVLVQNFHSFVMTDVIKAMGPTSLIMPMAVVVFGIFLFMVSIRAKNHGWIS